MANELARLKLRIEADTSRLKGGLAVVEGQAQRTGTRMSRSFARANRAVNGLTKSVFSARGAFVALAGVTALGFAVKKAIEFADEIGKTADAIGITTDTLQELRFASERSGVGVKELDKALLKFSKSVGEARADTGTLVELLRKLDPALLANVQTAGSLDEAFDVVITTIAGMSNATDRAALAAAAFGRSGVRMVNIVREGTGGLEALREEARRLGIVLDESMVRQAERANDQLTNMQRILGANLTRLLLGLAPTIERIGIAFAEAAPQIAAFIEGFVPGNVASVEELRRRITDLREELEKTAANRITVDDFMGEGFGTAEGRIDSIKNEIAELERLIERRKAANDARQVLTEVDIGFDAEQAARAVRFFNQTRTAEEKYAARLEELQELLAADSSFQDTFNRSVAQAKEEFEKSTAAAQTFGPAAKRSLDVANLAAERVSGTIERGVGDALFSASRGFEGFGDVALNVLASIQRALIDTFASNLIKGAPGFLAGLFGAGIGAGVSPTGGDIAGTPFAHGGRPTIGGVSIVGEEGPELFVADRAGTIIPNGGFAAGGGTTVVIHQQFDFRGASLEAAALLRQESARIKAETLAAIQSSASRGGPMARLARV